MKLTVKDWLADAVHVRSPEHEVGGSLRNSLRNSIVIFPVLFSRFYLFMLQP